MANPKGLAFIVSELRAERANLTNQLKGSRSNVTPRWRVFVLSTILLMLCVRMYSEEKNSALVQSFLGRWDLTLKTPLREYPSWLEITQQDGQLRARMVSRWGHARPLPKFELSNSRVKFVSPKEEEDRKDDMVFEGKLSGKALVGTTTGPDGTPWQWTGVRAPSLKGKSAPQWGKPMQLFNGKDLSGWKVSDLGSTAKWTVENGTLVSPGHGAELITDAKFEDFKLHVEFNCAPDRTVASTCAAGMNSRSKTIRSQRHRRCAPVACMASWLPRRNSRAGRESGRAMTSRWLGEWSPLYRMVRPLLTTKKFRASPAGLWIVTKHWPDRSICRGLRQDTSLFGTSRLRQQGDLPVFRHALPCSVPPLAARASAAAAHGGSLHLIGLPQAKCSSLENRAAYKGRSTVPCCQTAS